MVSAGLTRYLGKRNRGVLMLLHVGAVAAALVAAGVAVAEPLSADAARRFVVGKQFAYTCYDGTRGTGRVNGDGSVLGTIQVKGAGPVRQAMLPPGTLKV